MSEILNEHDPAWITEDGRVIKIVDLHTTHLHNIVRMLAAKRVELALQDDPTDGPRPEQSREARSLWRKIVDAQLATKHEAVIAEAARRGLTI